MQSPESALKREIGPAGLALNAMNLTIGSGIIGLPAIAAAAMGGAAFIAYLVCGLVIILIMLCYAEVGSKITVTGGSYVYVETSFGPFAGFLVNTLFWVGFSSVADAAVINLMTDMLSAWFPVFTIQWVRILFFLIIFGMLAGINIAGIKQGMRFTIVITILKLLPLVLLGICGLFYLKTTNLHIATWPAIAVTGNTSLTLFFAFAGSETALNVSGEVKQPQKNIPKGILGGITGVVLLYLLLQLVAQGVLGNDLSRYKENAFIAVAHIIAGKAGATVILIAGVVSMFGLLCGDVLASPRIVYAASRDKLLPAFLGKIHSKYATPYWAIIVYAALGFVFASTGNFKKLADLTSSFILLIYLAVALATIKLRLQKNTTAAGTFKIPGGLVVPVLAVVAIVWLLYHVSLPEIITVFVCITIFILFYFGWKMYQQKKLPKAVQ
ncbi:MAG: APC family permease [Bacteroidetes bacterium]|nr:APC family permease [Bacteroidota bacterium]